MPSEFQSGNGTEYTTEHERHICEWPEDWLLRLKPTPETARQYLAAANKHDAPTAVKAHMADQAKPE